MRASRPGLVIGTDGLVSCPACGGASFELFDPNDAMNDAATFALRKLGDGFERKDPYGGFTWQTAWHPETRRVACSDCKRVAPWPGYDLRLGGAGVE